MGTELKIPSSSAELSKALGLSLVGANLPIERVEPLSEIGPNGLCYAQDPLDDAFNVRAAVIAFPGTVLRTGGVIESENPRLGFVRALQWIDSHIGFMTDDSSPDINSTARISPSACIGKGVIRIKSFGTHGL